MIHASFSVKRTFGLGSFLDAVNYKSWGLGLGDVLNRPRISTSQKSSILS